MLDWGACGMDHAAACWETRWSSHTLCKVVAREQDGGRNCRVNRTKGHRGRWNGLIWPACSAILEHFSQLFDLLLQIACSYDILYIRTVTMNVE